MSQPLTLFEQLFNFFSSFCVASLSLSQSLSFGLVCTSRKKEVAEEQRYVYLSIMKPIRTQ